MSSQLSLNLIEPPHPTLDNFVVGDNAPAIAAVREFVAGRGPRFLYVWGPVGCGCSHLMRALGAGPGVPEFRGAGLYAVDAVDELDADGQEALFELMNQVRSDPGSRLACAGSTRPGEASPRADVTTRLGWGLVFQIRPLSDADTVAALERFAAGRGWTLAPEVAGWLLWHLPRDMRTLMAVMEAVDAYALEKKRAVTLPLVRACLRERGAGLDIADPGAGQ